jgi:hypothetical protein
MRAHVLIRGSLIALSLAFPLGMAPAQTPAGQPVQPTQKSDEALAALKKLLAEHPELIDQLKTLLEQTQKEKGIPPARPGQEPDIPPIQLPGDKTQPVLAPGTQSPAGARAINIPDISVIGNNVGRFLSVSGDPDRNRLQLGEFEIGLQQRIFPGIRFDAFLAGGAEDNFSMRAEEAYVTLSRVAKTPFGGILGQKRLNFGKVNPIHPHARNYADQPAALGLFLGEEALFGNGAALNYTFPFRNLFANLEVGFWKATAHGHGDEEEHEEHEEEEALTVKRRARAARSRQGEDGEIHAEPGVGIVGDFPLARLWLSKELGTGRELELGGSHGFGKAENGDRIGLTGLDLTYRMFPGAYSRLMLQGEMFWHRRKDMAGGSGSHTRSGHYALLSWRPDQYNEWGVRFDNSRVPWPLNGREQSYSLIYSNRLNEATLVRFQYKYGDRTHDLFLPARRGFSEFYLQFIWGGGSHTHQIQ